MTPGADRLSFSLMTVLLVAAISLFGLFMATRSHAYRLVALHQDEPYCPDASAGDGPCAGQMMLSAALLEHACIVTEDPAGRGQCISRVYFSPSDE